MTVTDCCEFSALSRRGFLGAAAAGAVVAYGATTMQTTYAAGSAPRTLVVLSLRGAADGMSLVVPYGDPVYYAARPRIAVPKEKLLATDGFFGLHPAFEPLLPMWNAGKMATVHAAGLPAPNRSHFAAMEELEDADPGSEARVGWINRLAGVTESQGRLDVVQLGETVPNAQIYGPVETVTAASLAKLEIPGADRWVVPGGRERSLATSFGANTGPLGTALRSTLAVTRDVAPAQSNKAARNGATYPDTDLGRALGDAARLIRADVGAEVVTVDHGSWDHHTQLGNLEWGLMLRMAGDLAKSLAAFFTDLGALGDQVTVVTLSEFGRRVKENDGWGLDHGFGNVVTLLGGGVRGGYHGRWPGLTNTTDADLLVTTDYRSVLSEVVQARLGVSSGQVFPGFSPESVGAVTSL